MLNEKNIQVLLEHWEIPNGLKIEDVSSKNWKTGEIEWPMWKVGDEYYLKTSERSRMIKNIRIAKALKKEGLSSEFLPIPTKSGSDYLDGERIFLLTKKVGDPLIDKPLTDDEIMSMNYHENRTKYAFKLGLAVAKLHRALKAIQNDVMPYEANLYNQGIKSVQKVKEYSQKYMMGIGDEFFDDYERTFGKLYNKLPKQLVHGNLTGDSIVYEGGEIIGLKGYEVYNVSHIRIFDVIYCAGEINTQLFDSYIESLKNILAGYNSLSPLGADERQAVYYILCSIAMNMLAYCDGCSEA